MLEFIGTPGVPELPSVSTIEGFSRKTPMSRSKSSTTRPSTTLLLPNRISRDEMLMMFAFVASLRSTCGRRQVGAIISREGRVLSTGYAGPPSGIPHCSSEICDLSTPCTRTIHAEMNAILFAAKVGISTQGSSIYCTDSPCQRCAEAIVNAGIKAVYFARPYRDSTPLEFLKSLSIATVQCDLPAMLAIQKEGANNAS